MDRAAIVALDQVASQPEAQLSRVLGGPDHDDPPGVKKWVQVRILWKMVGVRIRFHGMGQDDDQVS